MFLFLLGACLKSPPAPSEADKKFCSTAGEWSACLDKEVSLSATSPDMLYQHPSIASPEGEDSVQGYIAVGKRQLIVLSDAPNPCSGTFSVEGILKEISLGGEPGTKGSYRNFYLSRARFRCP